MMLSAKARYAVQALAHIAARDVNAPVTLALIAQEQDIPLPYLEQIFVRLKRAGLVQSVRGPGGGYRLARAAASVSVAQIIAASEEPVRMTRCSAEAGACRAGKARCLTHDLWNGLERHIHEYLAAISLADIVHKRYSSKLALAAG